MGIAKPTTTFPSNPECADHVRIPITKHMSQLLFERNLHDSSSRDSYRELFHHGNTITISLPRSVLLLL
jgi:hypothetical protein